MAQRLTSARISRNGRSRRSTRPSPRSSSTGSPRPCATSAARRSSFSPRSRAWEQLGGHQTYAGFITALHVFLADVFGATAVYVCRIIKVATANGESRAFVVGNADISVPLQCLPLAFKAFDTSTEGDFPILTDAANEVPNLKVVSWSENTGAASAYGRPEVLVPSGEGERTLLSELSNQQRRAITSRPATRDDASHVAALHVGEAILLFSRTETPLSWTSSSRHRRLSGPIGTALREVSCRSGWKEALKANARLRESVVSMASGEKAV